MLRILTILRNVSRLEVLRGNPSIRMRRLPLDAMAACSRPTVICVNYKQAPLG